MKKLCTAVMAAVCAAVTALSPAAQTVAELSDCYAESALAESYSESYVEIIDIKDSRITLRCTLTADWEADYCIIERKTDTTAWTQLETQDNYDYASDFVVWYTDYDMPTDEEVTYRFTFYKYTIYGIESLTDEEITIENGEPADDIEPPTISVISANADLLDIEGVFYTDLKLEGCRIDMWNGNYWDEVGNTSLEHYSDEGYYRFKYVDYFPETGRHNYRFTFYKYLNYEVFDVISFEKEIDITRSYSEAYIYDQKINDTSVWFGLKADENILSCIVSRRSSDTEAWKKVGLFYSDSTESSYGMHSFSISDTGLKADTSYTYKFEFYDSTDNYTTSVSATLETTIHTVKPPEKPVLLDAVAHQDSVTVRAKVDSRWNAEGFEIHRYSNKNKKWEMLADSDELRYYDDYEEESDEYGYYQLASYTDSGLKSTTKYSYKIKLYRTVDGKREYFSTLSKSVYTLMAAPKLKLGATAKKATLSWSKVKGAAGYEVYVLAQDKSAGSGDGWWWYYDNSYSDGYYTTIPQYHDSLKYYNQCYNSSLSPKPVSDFKKKSTVTGGKTSVSYNIKSSKSYIYIVRAYKKSGSKKLYGEFSAMESTDSTSSLLNGIKLNPKVTVNDADLALIKKALKKCVNDKMTPAEKAAAIYDYVHSIAVYEYDYSKIPNDPIEAILSAKRGQCYQYAVTYQAMMKYIGYDVKLVSGKTSSGGPHWWCELTCAGTTYMIDPQVGGRFLIMYDRMGYYAPTKEKVYD